MAPDVFPVKSASRAPRDLVVVSDLHLGRGLNPRTKRYHRLEAFFYDGDFRAFCRHLCDAAKEGGSPFTLVLNGDVFDLLRIEPEPGVGETAIERRFGALPMPPLAARMVAEILVGHAEFVEALADVLAAGQEIVFLPGNHDLELQWEPVQEEVRKAVAATLSARGAQTGERLARMRFEPWFYYEPGRIWIEHGCQYDPENAFRFPLRRGLADPPHAAAVAERDMPLGNFFQKYLYNAFGNITFIVPSGRANYRYFRWLLANRPRLLLHVALSHGGFLLQLLRRLARAPATAWLHPAEEAHAAELAELAERSGLGERLKAVDALKSTGADAARAAAGILRQGAKLVLGALLGALLALAVWSTFSRAIEALHVGFGWKALLSLVLDLLFLAAVAALLVSAALRVPPEEPSRQLPRVARRIAAILGVPLVTFGHTHDEMVSPIERPGGGWYFNTGTWIAVFTHDVLLPRERVQHTFLRIRGGEAELLQWSPGRSRPIPVILLEEKGWEGQAGTAGEQAGDRPESPAR